MENELDKSSDSKPSSYVWYEDMRNKQGKGRIWVCYGPQIWCSYSDWILPGTLNLEDCE